MQPNLKYWLGFNLVRGIGPMRLRALLDHFGDIEAAWHAPEAALHEIRLDRRAIRNLIKVRRQNDLDTVVERVTRAGVHVLTWESPDYPSLLAQVDDAPPCSTSRGRSHRQMSGLSRL